MISTMKRIVLIATLISAIALFVAQSGISNVLPAAAQGVEISLDADVSDGGPCGSIDPEATVEPGQAFQVAACIKGLSAPLGVFKFDIIYDDTLVLAPEIPLINAGLDDNPDANTGSTTWGESLGEGWSCDIMDLGQQPVGDSDPATGANHGVAQIACWTLTGTTTLGDNEDSGVLAVLSFVAGPNPGGPTSLLLTGGETADSAAIVLGTCNPGVEPLMACNGAAITVAGAAIPAEQVPSPTPFSGQVDRTVPASGDELLSFVDTPSAPSGETTPSAATPGSTAGGGTNETATPAPGDGDGMSTGATEDENQAAEEDDDGNNWILPVVLAAVAGVAVLGGASALYWRRRRS